jgi:hypothetical protein
VLKVRKDLGLFGMCEKMGWLDVLDGIMRVIMIILGV